MSGGPTPKVPPLKKPATEKRSYPDASLFATPNDPDRAAEPRAPKGSDLDRTGIDPIGRNDGGVSSGLSPACTRVALYNITGNQCAIKALRRYSVATGFGQHQHVKTSEGEQAMQFQRMTGEQRSIARDVSGRKKQ